MALLLLHRRLASPRTLATACGLAALILTLGCASSEHDSLAATRRAFVVDSVPTVDIGNEADGPHAIFSGPVFPALLSDGGIVVANGDSQELRFFSASGEWIRSVGRAGSGPGEFTSLGWLQVGTADSIRTYDWGQLRVQAIDAYVAATVADAPSERRAAATEMLRRAPYPRSLPAYATFLLADDGTVWVGRYLARGYEERQTFDVLDATGAMLGAVEMPARFSPSQVVRDRLIGLWRDEDDVVHVRVYRLVREQ